MASEMDDNSICFAESKPAKIFKWKVQEHSTITAGHVLFTYQYEDEMSSNGSSENSEGKNNTHNHHHHVFRATKGGVVDKLLVKEGANVSKGMKLLTLKECTHPTVMKDLCAECGADLREVKQRNQTAAVAIVHNIPELMVSMEEAQQLGKADEQRLVRDRKLVLLVDLDQTLIHTTNDTIPTNIKDVYHFRLHGGNSPWYHTRFRPYTLDFLEKISKMYELHICTFGSRTYAHTIAGLLDKDGRYFSHRILSRDECFSAHSKIANMKAIFPCGDHMVCIIDDREDVWSFAPNLIHVRPYHFFQHTGDINAPPGLAKQEFDDKEGFDFETLKMKKNEDEEKEEDGDDSKDSKAGENKEETKKEDEVAGKMEEKEENQPKENGESNEPAAKEKRNEDLIEPVDSDDYLLHLENILTTIHQAYYAMYDQMLENREGTEVPDMKRIIPYVRRKTLQGVTLVFSGVIPTHIPMEKSRPFLVARSLGAVVSDRVTEKTTHLVAARLGTTKVNDAKKIKGLHIVTPDWLWCCAERWEHVDERLYPLNSDTCAIHRKPPPHCSSPDVTLQLAAAASVPEQREVKDVPVYDRVTGKRIFPQNADKGKAWADNKARRPQPPRRFSETINPMLMFSSDDIADMDREVEDILHEGESEGEDEEEAKEEEEEEEVVEPEEEKEEWPHHKRKRKLEETEEDESPLKLGLVTDPEDEENQTLMERFRHGEMIEADLDQGKAESEDEEEEDEDFGRDEGDDLNDVDWAAAGEALEREFLSESEA